MALRPGLFGANFDPNTPTKIKTVDLVEPMCLRCIKRIISHLQDCDRTPNKKCEYCSRPTINKPCIPIPDPFTARANTLITLRNTILEHGRAATAADLKMEKDFTKDVEAFTNNARKFGFSPNPTAKPNSVQDFMGLQLHESRVQSTVMQEHAISAGESATALQGANTLKQSTNQLLAGLLTAVQGLNSAYRQAHGLPATDGNPPPGPPGPPGPGPGPGPPGPPGPPHGPFPPPSSDSEESDFSGFSDR